MENKEDNQKRSIKDTISSFIQTAKSHPKASYAAILAIVFIIGFAIGKIGTVSSSKYNKIFETNQETRENYDDVKEDYDTLMSTYSKYKEKMQPYEEQQAADAEAAEKAQKEAEEKAAAEAAEKAQKEAEEKAAAEAAEKATATTEKKYTLEHGELVSANIDSYDNIIVIKAKISPSYSNEATINQNYYNINDLVKNQGVTEFDELQYWAVADMTDGSERKVISFTVSSDIMERLKDDRIVANKLGNYVDDLWILSSLLKED